VAQFAFPGSRQPFLGKKPIVAGEEKMLERWRLILQPDLLLARVAANPVRNL